jgi:hypothetical protein
MAEFTPHIIQEILEVYFSALTAGYHGEFRPL